MAKTLFFLKYLAYCIYLRNQIIICAVFSVILHVHHVLLKIEPAPHQLMRGWLIVVEIFAKKILLFFILDMCQKNEKGW